jgi:alpha-galactosidase
MLAQLAERYGCDWIKLDFNLDPGPGCNRTDHGHGAGDGLFAHYTGYYRTLARFRAGHPGVVLENCSSGGLRGDLGMMRQTHVSFLSDPDWPEHTLQAFWGASMVLAPEVCLRWSWSESAQGSSEKRFDPHDPNLQPHQLDYYIRTALLGAAGFSLRLPDLPDWVRDRIRFHAHLYRERIRRFIRSGDLYRLTDQPRRIGDGERWCAFQLSLPHEHVVFVFRLPGAEPARRVHPQRLDPKMHYLLEWVDGNQSELLPGRDLMENGILVDRLREQDSGIAFVKEHQQT